MTNQPEIHSHFNKSVDNLVIKERWNFKEQKEQGDIYMFLVSQRCVILYIVLSNDYSKKNLMHKEKREWIGI